MHGCCGIVLAKGGVRKGGVHSNIIIIQRCCVIICQHAYVGIGICELWPGKGG